MYFLEAKNVDIGEDILKTNFLHSQRNNTYMRYTRGGLLFYEPRMFLNMVKGMIVENRAADPFKTDFVDPSLGVSFCNSENLF